MAQEQKRDESLKVSEDLISKMRDLNFDRQGKDYLRTWDLNSDEVKAVLYTAQTLENLHRNNVDCRVFQSGLAVSNFRDNSTRTRFSFASAASLLGLTVQDFDEQKSQVGHGETVRETAAMVSFLTEAIGIRDDLYVGQGHKYMVESAASIQESADQGILAQRPTLVNLQCDEDHPTQSMADLMHLVDHFGSLGALKGKKIAMTWAYSPSYGKPLSVPQGIIALMTRYGMDVTLAHPKGYELLPHVLEVSAKHAKESGGSFKVTNDMAEAFKGADVVYPKSWGPMVVMEKRSAQLVAGKATKDEMARLEKECLDMNKQFMDWECTEELMKLTTNGGSKQEAIYMHCLPADISGVSTKNGEVQASVFDRYRLATYREASHKPFVIAAAILLGRLPNPVDLLQRLLVASKPRRTELVPKLPSGTKSQRVGGRPGFDIMKSTQWPTEFPPSALDAKIAALAQKYSPLAVEILKEAIRIPADHVAQDPACGTSNHEGPRVEYLKSMIIKHNMVESKEDVFFDDFGNLVWTVQDSGDGIKPEDKKVIFFDGHTDTVNPLPEQWRKKIGGVDVYKGLVDASHVDVDFLRSELGYLPPKEEWKHLLFGRGGADQLSGVVAQMITTKILLELKGEGALKGIVIRSYGTVAEEDNDGGGPMYVFKHLLPKHPELLPDVVVHTEGTGDKDAGACGIYIGQRGRMIIEVEVVGKSCHGSMPWEGLNPMEYGARIILEAREQYDQGVAGGFLNDDFLGGGTRTASWSTIETPSDCAVPASFTFRFDRRITVGETPEHALEQIRNLPAVARARKDGLTVDIRVPKYETPTWRGFTPGNDQIYMGWMTPPQHPAVQTAYASWKRVVTNQLLKEQPDFKEGPQTISREPRVSRWIFSTDGVGYPQRKDNKAIVVPKKKLWVDQNDYHHPAQIGMGIGFEQNTHKIGEFIDVRHFPAAIAFMARFCPLYYENTK